MIMRSVKGNTFSIQCDLNGDIHLQDLAGMGMFIGADEVNELRQLLDHVWQANSMYRYTSEYIEERKRDEQRRYGVLSEPDPEAN